MSLRGDQALLIDILQGAELATTELGGATLADFRADYRKVALLRLWLQDIGEAARGVSQPTRDLLPNIPFKKIVGTRNILTHRYFDVDESVLYALATNHLPSLIVELRAYLGDAAPPRVKDL